MTNTEQGWFYKLPNITDDDPGDKVQFTADFGYAANFMTLRSDKLYLDIADISSLGISNIRQGYYPLILTSDDGKDKTVYKTILFIIAAPILPPEPEPKKPCDPNCSFHLLPKLIHISQVLLLSKYHGTDLKSKERTAPKKIIKWI